MSKKQTTDETTENTVANAKETKQSSLYTKEELIEGYRAFNVPKFVVKVALDTVKKEKLTEKEAQEIIVAFNKKKI